jgi:hypothetical protein
MVFPYYTSYILFYIRSSRTPSAWWQCEVQILCTCGEGIISCHYYLFNCKCFILGYDELQRSVGNKFNIQSVFKDEMGIKALLDFAKYTGLGYCKIVRCRSTPLEKDKENMDEG